MRRPFQILLLLFLGARPGIAALQSPTVLVQAEVDRQTVTVGDRIQLTIQVVHPTNLEIVFPGPDLDMAPFEILDSTRQDNPLETGELETQLIYSLTTFESGSPEIPPVSISFRSSPEDNFSEIESEPIAIQVMSVLPEDAEDIQDIKPLVEIGRDWIPLIIAFGAGIAAVIAGAYWYRRYRSRGRQDAPPTPQTPPLPPHVLAYQELERLRQSGLLDKDPIKPFYIEVSTIIRRYIEGRFGVEALELTTSEMLAELGDRARVEDREIIHLFLEKCDLVKFAKLTPPRYENEKILDIGFEIVDQTQPVPDPPEPTESSPSKELEPRQVVNQEVS